MQSLDKTFHATEVEDFAGAVSYHPALVLRRDVKEVAWREVHFVPIRDLDLGPAGEQDAGVGEGAISPASGTGDLGPPPSGAVAALADQSAVERDEVEAALLEALDGLGRVEPLDDEEAIGLRPARGCDRTSKVHGAYSTHRSCGPGGVPVRMAPPGRSREMRLLK